MIVRSAGEIVTSVFRDLIDAASMVDDASAKGGEMLDGMNREIVGHTVYEYSALNPAAKIAEDREKEVARLSEIIKRSLYCANTDSLSFRAAAEAIYEDRRKG